MALVVPTGNEAIVSFGCGAGVQAIAERYPNKAVYAGPNTNFLGILEEQAVLTEKCMSCGDCMLAEFGGICPITRCAKHMLNGPCGGSTTLRCEVAADKPCAWLLISRSGSSTGWRGSTHPRTGAWPGPAARASSSATSIGCSGGAPPQRVSSFALPAHEIVNQE